MLWPKYCITKITKVLYYKSKQSIVLYYKSKQRCYGQSITKKVCITKYCITKVNKRPKYCITKVNKDVLHKVLYYKSKQSIIIKVLQK